ncbi:MAGBG protein, partial [Crocuta crocuta]
QADLQKNVIKKYKGHFPEILRRASECTELVSGLDVKEMNPTSHCYALVNKLDLTYDGSLSGEEGMSKIGLLIIILGVISLKGKEKNWDLLNMMDIYSGKKHFVFEEPNRSTTRNSAKEKYLEYQQVPKCDPPHYKFPWSLRAHMESSKMKVLEFLAK